MTLSGFRVFLVFALGLTFASAQTANPLASEPNVVETGRGLFHLTCTACHGKEAQGGRGPDLTRGAFANGDRDSDLFRVITDGVPGSEMAAYGARINKDNIWRIIAFIRSTSVGASAPLAGDRAHGESLFWGKSGCGNCHSVRSRGNRIGPDLTLVGRQRSAAYLRVALLKPDEDLLPDYQTVTVVMRDGKSLSGIRKALDDFSVQFMDLQGKYYSFERSEVQSYKVEARSLMPSFEKTLSTTELEDVLTYLQSLQSAR